MKNNPKILVYGHKDNTLMSKWPQYHIYDELQFHNCTIYEFDAGAYDSFKEINEQLIKYINNTKIDLFMTSSKGETLSDKTFNILKKKDIKTLLFCCDPFTLQFQYKSLKLYDLIWLTNKDTKKHFDKLGLHTIFMPLAANPNMNNCIKARTKGICFIGTPYGGRINVINTLTRNGIDVYCTYHTNACDKSIKNKTSFFDKINNFFQHAIVTQGRKLIISSFINRFVLRTKLNINSNLKLVDTVKINKMYETYSDYSLCLTSTTAGHTCILKHPLYICVLKCFEIPMSGGVLFAQYNKELDSYFKDGVEAVYYRNEEDMIKKARYYLDPEHRDELLKIKHNAREKAQNYHTWWIRYKKIFDLLSIEYND